MSRHLSIHFSPHPSRLFLALVAFLALSSLQNAACPGTITDSYNMSASESSTSSCFVIGTPNIVLDCKGYTVSLTGGAAVPAIDVNAANVTIQNCNVVENSATNVVMGAVLLRATATNTTITDTNISSVGHFALNVNSSSNTITRVKSNTSSQSSYGSYFSASSNNVISHSIFNKTATASTYAIYWNGGSGNRLDNMTVDASLVAGKYGARFDGFTSSNITNSFFTSANLTALWFASGSDGNRVDGTRITTGSTSAGHGIYMDLSSGNQIYNSNVTVSGVGIYILSSSGSTRIENVTINSTASSGIYIDPSVASDYNVINRVTVSALNYPLFLSPSSYNTVENSTLLSTANHGVYSDTIVSSNRFYNNTIRSRLSGGTAFAMYFVGTASSNTILQNSITSPTYYSLYFAASDSNSNTIVGNDIDAQAGAGYGVTFAATPSSYNNVSSNRISAAAYGVQIYGDQNYVNDNNISAATIGIYLVSTTNSEVIRNYVNTTGNSPLYLSGADSNVIGGNTLNKTGTGAFQGLILTTASSNIVENNTIISEGQDAVRLTTSANGNTFTNNYFYTNMTGTVYGLQITTNCQNNRFYGNNITSWNSLGVIITANSRFNVISGGSIFSRASTALTISSSSYNNVTNTSIRSSNDTAGLYGIYLTSANNNRFSNVDVYTNASYAGYLTSAVNNNDFNNVTFYSRGAVGVYMLTNVYSNTFRNFAIHTNNTNALQMDGGAGAVYGNSFTNGTIRTNATAGYAAYFNNNANNNTFTNVTMNNTVYRSVYFLTSSNNIINASTIAAGTTASSIGVLTQTLATGNQIINSVISAPGASAGYDIYFNSAAAQPSNIVAINSTFDQFDVAFLAGDTASYLNVSWYLRANVTDSSGAYPVESATVVYRDTFGSQWANLTTDSSGLTSYYPVLQYRRNSSGSVTYTPYNLSASIGAISTSASATPTSSMTQNINLNASTCQALSSDYNMTNNVYSSGACFSVSAPGITLDCNNYFINYSRSNAGCGFYSNSYINLNLKNCQFVQGAYNSSSSAAICLSSGANATLYNSTFSTLGSGGGYDFNLSSSNATAVNVSLSTQNNSLFYGNSSLQRSWYLRVNLTDLSGSPIPVGNVQVNNSLNQSVANVSVTDGASPVMILAQYLQTGASSFVFYSNFTILGYSGLISNTTRLNLTANSNVTIQLNVSSCGVVGSSRTLSNSLYSSGTCLTPSTSGITIDCAGYSINYSRSGNGYYGIDTANYDNIIVKNCNFYSGNQSAALSYDIFVNHSSGVEIHNSTLNGRSLLLNYSSLNTRLAGTQFNNSTVVLGDSTSNLSVSWYVNVHAIGLAGEDVNGSLMNATNYQGLVANGTTNQTGYVTFLLSQYNQNQSVTASLVPYNISTYHPTTLVPNSTNVSPSSNLNVTIGLISASIEILTPTENQIYFQGDSVNITVNESLGSSWVNNVTVQVTGDSSNSTYNATEISADFWSYIYSVDPAQPSATLTITARGYNGAAFVSATRNFVVTRSSGSGVAQPVLNYFCPAVTYLSVNQTTNITASADLDTVLYSFTLQVTHPNSTNTSPSAIASSEDSSAYIYNRTWSFTPENAGTYQIFTEARDVNDNRVNLTKYLYVSSSNATVNLSASGTSSLSLRDVCSGATIASGANLSTVSVPPGNYTLVAQDSNKTAISLLQFNVSSFTGSVMTYERVTATITPPTNRRNVFTFSSTIHGGQYSSTLFSINYSEDAATLVAENSLEIYNCASVGSCNWSIINSTLSTSTDMVNASASNISGVYGLFEPAYTEPQNNTVNITVIQYQSSTQIVYRDKEVEVIKEVPVDKLVEVPVKVYTSVRLISGPSLIEMHPMEGAEAEITLSNRVGDDMGEVSLSAESNSPEVSVSLDGGTFSLPPGSSASTKIRIGAPRKTGSYEIRLLARSPKLDIEDELTIPVVVSYNLEADRLSAQKKLEFAGKLLQDNPECLELDESLASASLFFESGKYAEADERAQSAISGCSGIMALRGKPLIQAEMISNIDMGLVAVLTLVLTGAFASLALIAYMIWHRVKRREFYKEHAHHGGRDAAEEYHRRHEQPPAQEPPPGESTEADSEL